MYTETGRRQGILLTPREIIGLLNAILCVLVISIQIDQCFRVCKLPKSGTGLETVAWSVQRYRKLTCCQPARRIDAVARVAYTEHSSFRVNSHLSGLF
jgi:hypothetical protein